MAVRRRDYNHDIASVIFRRRAARGAAARGLRGVRGIIWCRNDFFPIDALAHKNDALDATTPAARPRTGEIQKSESVTFMSAVNGGDRHARCGVDLAELLAIVF